VGQRTSQVRSSWGFIQVRVQRLRDEAGREHSYRLDGSLDGSGYTPWVLERLLELAGRLPYEEAAELGRAFGLEVSAAGLARLHATYGKALEETLCASLQERAWAALAEGEGRVMVLEVDGVRVAGQPHPSTHRCEGIEVKTALVYPQRAPGARTRMAGVMKPEQLLPQLSGLLRAAGVQRQDEVIGVSDGAVWIEQLYQTLGIPQVIDVFHASQYLEQVMLELGWSEEERAEERRRWLRGEVAGGEWLGTYCPPPTAPERQSWSEEARSAIQYLEQRADRMDYPAYKDRGWPIGSGQVEGMNKHVIGARMKRSGMQWSRPGASRTAAHRAQLCSSHPLVAFEALRWRAFPVRNC